MPDVPRDPDGRPRHLHGQGRHGRGRVRRQGAEVSPLEFRLQAASSVLKKPGFFAPPAERASEISPTIHHPKSRASPMPDTYIDIAKMIDHSLLNPTLTSEEMEAGLKVAVEYDVASVCIQPYYL